MLLIILIHYKQSENVASVGFTPNEELCDNQMRCHILSKLKMSEFSFSYFSVGINDAFN